MGPTEHQFLHINKCTLQEYSKKMKKKIKRKIIVDGCVSDKENWTVLKSEPRVLDEIKTDSFGLILSKYSNSSTELKLKFNCLVRSCNFEGNFFWTNESRHLFQRVYPCI